MLDWLPAKPIGSICGCLGAVLVFSVRPNRRRNAHAIWFMSNIFWLLYGAIALDFWIWLQYVFFCGANIIEIFKPRLIPYMAWLKYY